MRKLLLFVSLLAAITVMSFDDKPEKKITSNEVEQIQDFVDQSFFICSDCGEILEGKVTKNGDLVLKCNCGFRDIIEAERFLALDLLVKGEMECGEWFKIGDLWCQECWINGSGPFTDCL